MHLAQIALTEILPPEHAIRAAMDEGLIRELSESITRVGLLQPIKVKRVEGGFEVIHGHRRLLASQMANLVAIPCLVWEEGESCTTAQKVHENLYREELSPVEEGGFYAEIYEQMGQDVDRVCAEVHQSRNYVEKRLSLLSGNRNVLQALVEKTITLGVAEELNKLKFEADQNYYLDWAIRQGATVAIVRDWRRSVETRQAFDPNSGAVTPAGEAPEVPDGGPTPCMFCGSADDQHMMQFKMVHSYCLRQVEQRVLEASPASEEK